MNPKSYERFLLCTLTILVLATQASSTQKLSLEVKEKIGEDTGEKIRVIVMTEGAPIRQAIQSKDIAPTRTYSHIPAYAASLTTSQISTLSETLGVKKIFLDRRVQRIKPLEGGLGLKLQASVDSIGARFVREQLNITGRNVTVAVIDTGIDYNHPDLGGCFGPSCRVIGGFDFVYNDSNPIDDHSHGTHVAGIIGANGSLTGVAPDASFLALKVCDVSGWCWDSDIIAAIDWALVNNADVISMSLGGIYQPNDEVSVLELSVAEAVKQGITVAVSAGNSGPGAQTTEHPASSGAVITVGSSNDRGTTYTSDDVLSSFSSRGPSAWGRLDPDILAPGSSIYSTVLSSLYGVKSGTSMAAPHVAGAAALLLESNPALTPLQVRRKLMNSAENISGRVFDKGAGQINVSRAIQSTVSATTGGSDRFEGIILPGQNTSITVNYSNTANATRNLTLTLEDFYDAKQYLTISSEAFSYPATASLSANSSVNIQLNITLPSNVSAGIYGGTLVAQSEDNQSIRLPIVFSIPLIGAGTVSGKVNLGGVDEGDWIYIPVKPLNSASITLNLSAGNQNLDLYLYAPNGEIINSSATSGPEILIAYNLSYDTYWAVVHGRSVSSEVVFNLTVAYPSNYSVSPPSWAGVYGGDMKQVTFTITNNNETKENMTLSVVSAQEKLKINHTVSVAIPKRVQIPGDPKNFSYMDLSCTYIWLDKDLNQTLDGIWYVDVNTSWTPNHNLDLYLAHWLDDGDQVLEAGEHNETRYASTSENKISGLNTEYISYANILYYNSIYTDVGVAVCNPENTTDYNGTINTSITLYDRQAFNRVQINPSTLNLSAYESKNINLSFNITGLTRGEKYNLTLLTGDSASVLILFESGNPTTPVISAPSTYHTAATVSLDWAPSSSTVNISYYLIEYGNDSAFASKSSVNSTTNTVNLTLTDGLVYLRVKAVDSEGFTSPWSSTVNTTVDTLAPTTPTLQFNPIALGNYTPLVNWTPSVDENSGVSYYLFQLSWNDSFENTTLSLNTSNTSTILNLSDGIHSARVRAYDAAGNPGNFSPTKNKTVKTIFLNEIHPQSQWIELYSTRAENTNLTGWSLTTNQGNTTLTQEITAQWTLLLNTTQFNITLNQSNDTITLTNPQNQLIDNITIENMANETSIGRSIDGSGTWTSYNSSTMTPGVRNYRTEVTQLQIGYNLISLPLALDW